jgi:heme a synthase
MGVDAAHPTAPATSQRSLPGRAVGWALSPMVLRRLAVASVVVNVMIVVTGGAVRLTNSGLGCPTWPRCSGSSLVPTEKLGVHGAIEFSNRMLTYVVGLVLLATLIAAWRQHRETRLAAVLLASIPAQAVLGGLVVLTDLNPWLVAVHFLLSIAIIAAAFLLWSRLSAAAAVSAPQPVRLLARALVAVTAAVLAIGTVVTGSGPHAGELTRSGGLHRIAIRTSSITQLHSDAVMVLLGITLGLLAVLHAVQVPEPAKRAAWVLLGVELAQGAVGYTQYFLHVPPLLVGFHLLGACLVWIAALRVLLLVDPPQINCPTA